MTDTRGMAVPVLLLLLLALTALAHGALLLSMAELGSVEAFVGALRSREAAEAAVGPALEGWAGLPSDRTSWVLRSLASGSPDEGLRFQAGLRWLDGEFFLLEGVGRVRGRPGQGRRGWVGWSLGPAVRLASMGAGVEVGGGFTGAVVGSLSAADFRRPPARWSSSACAPFDALLDSIFPTGPPPLLGPLESPTPEDLGSASPVPPLGLLTGEYLLAMDPVGQLPGAVLPGPVPPSQGTPADSVRGCPPGEGPAFVSRGGSLTLDRGRFCGLLVVEGNLRLTGTAHLQGLVLVGGDLTLEGGAVIEGTARVGGTLRILAGAGFEVSACPVIRALTGLPGLGRPFLLPEAGPLNGF